MARISRNNFSRQDSKVLAVFEGIDKTTLVYKYPNLCRDIETAVFGHGYDTSVVDCKQEKYKVSYIKEIMKALNNKAIITIIFSVEILHLLDRMGVKYDVIYPQKEIKEIQDRTKPENIYYAKGDDTLEDILLKEGIVDNLVLNNSSFIYDDIKYRVNFTPCKESDIEKKFPDFSQVYCLGNVDGRALVIYYEKSEGKIFNLPGGTRESGENLEENLRREILEETNCEVLDYKVLGTQINISEHGEIYKPQIRVFANLRPLGKFVNDPGGSVKGYELVSHDDIEKYIQWGEVGDWLRLKTKKDFEK